MIFLNSNKIIDRILFPGNRPKPRLFIVKVYLTEPELSAINLLKIHFTQKIYEALFSI